MDDVQKKLKNHIQYMKYRDYYIFYYQYRSRVLGIPRRQGPDVERKQKQPKAKPVAMPLKIEAGHFELSFD
jgi:predicted phosphoadenosine phosphosulfate sulfurtransferase